MPPFRPANLNKKAYPGNASVIGPTRTATVGITTTTCCSSTGSFGACVVQNILGCRCTFCACPFCCACCSCSFTCCIRTVPSGRWKASEQMEARTRDAWGPNTDTAGVSSLVSCTNVGVACTGVTGISDCKGFFICCGPSTCKWFVAPECTQVSRNFHDRANAVTVANSCMGCCGWFVPSCGILLNPGYSCRTYWDSYCVTSYWSDTGYVHWRGSHNLAHQVEMSNGSVPDGLNYGGGYASSRTGSAMCIRAFRCTAT